VEVTTSPIRTRGQIRRWRQYLADERSEAAGYRKLAERRTGEEREILLALADAEKRHESHWLKLLGDDVGAPRRSSVPTRLLVFLAAHFGSVFVLALMQRAEGRSPYETDPYATDQMAAQMDGEPSYPVEYVVVDVRADGARGAAQFAWDEASRSYLEIGRYPG